MTRHPSLFPKAGDVQPAGYRCKCGAWAQRFFYQNCTIDPSYRSQIVSDTMCPQCGARFVDGKGKGGAYDEDDQDEPDFSVEAPASRFYSEGYDPKKLPKTG